MTPATLPRPRAILFDLDDTCFDRAEAFQRYVPLFAQRYAHRLGPCPADQLLATLLEADGRGYTERNQMAEILRRKLPWTTPSAAPEVADLVAGYRDDLLACTQLDPHLIPALRELRRRGIKTGLITNGYTAVQRRKIDRFQLVPLMDAILVSEEVGVKKPDPRIFRLALARLGVQPADAWFVGDHPDLDIAAAQSAGLTPLWIPRMNPWPPNRPPHPHTIRELSRLLPLVDAATWARSTP